MSFMRTWSAYRPEEREREGRDQAYHDIEPGEDEEDSDRAECRGIEVEGAASELFDAEDRSHRAPSVISTN